jgi:hypothetical protein
MAYPSSNLPEDFPLSLSGSDDDFGCEILKQLRFCDCKPRPAAIQAHYKLSDIKKRAVSRDPHDLRNGVLSRKESHSGDLIGMRHNA